MKDMLIVHQDVDRLFIARPAPRKSIRIELLLTLIAACIGLGLVVGFRLAGIELPAPVEDPTQLLWSLS